MLRRLIVVGVLASACTLQRTAPARSVAMDDHMSHMSAADMQGPSATRSASSAAQNAALPASNSAAPARIAASPRHAEWVKIAMEPGSKDTLMAWVVYPVSRAKAPVVVVVHEIFGLSTWVRGVADQVAADGFIAVAPDFLSRVRGGPTSVEMNADSARAVIGGVTTAERNRIINAAAGYAMTLPSAEPRYGVIGYCWGGQTVFNHAIDGGVKGFSGGVAYYGLPSYMTQGQRATATSSAVASTFIVDSLKKISKPVMLLSGTGDARITAAMPALDSLMKSMRKDYAQTNYEGAIHGFLRAQDDPMPPPSANRPPPSDSAKAVFALQQAANLAATKDGWPKTIAFLKKNLGVK